MEQIRSMAPPVVFETERLVLRQPRMSDARDIFANYASDPEVTRYMTWRPYNDQNEIAPFLQSRLSKWQSGEEYSWVITLPADDRAIGIACRARDHAADIGYVLGHSYWGRGYTTEAARANVDWASRVENIYRVWAACDAENKASARVLEKSGCGAKVFLAAISFIPTFRSSQGTVLSMPRFVK